MEDREETGSVSQSWSQLPEYCPDFDDLLGKNQDKLHKIHDLFRDIGEAQMQFSVKVLGRQKGTIFDKCGMRGILRDCGKTSETLCTSNDGYFQTNRRRPDT